MVIITNDVRLSLIETLLEVCRVSNGVNFSDFELRKVDLTKLIVLWKQFLRLKASSVLSCFFTKIAKERLNFVDCLLRQGLPKECQISGSKKSLPAVWSNTGAIGSA
jgi:hypothetical protein